MTGPSSLITATEISRNRDGVIRCPHCPETFPRRYRGNLQVGADWLTGVRLSGFRLLAEHLEQEHSEGETES